MSILEGAYLNERKLRSASKHLLETLAVELKVRVLTLSGPPRYRHLTGGAIPFALTAR